MNKEIELIIDKKIKEKLEEFGIKEDMLGYKNIYNDLKEKILKEEYNTSIEKEKSSITID